MNIGAMVKDTLMIAPVAMTNTETQTANLDTRGADYAVIRFPVSAEKNTDGKGLTISLLESDDTVVTNFATFDSNFEVTGAVDQQVAAKGRVYLINCKARKRFLRLSLTTQNSTNDDLTVSAVGSLYVNEQEPASATAIHANAVIG